MRRIHAKVTGRVQGVFYRASTMDTARALGLTGWVKNMMDGSVELEAQGPDDKVEKLIIWLNEGPPHARVEHVHVTDIPIVEGERDFVVDY